MWEVEGKSCGRHVFSELACRLGHYGVGTIKVVDSLCELDTGHKFGVDAIKRVAQRGCQLYRFSFLVILCEGGV